MNAQVSLDQVREELRAVRRELEAEAARPVEARDSLRWRRLCDDELVLLRQVRVFREALD